MAPWYGFLAACYPAMPRMWVLVGLLLERIPQVRDFRPLVQLGIANTLLGFGLHKKFPDILVVFPCPVPRGMIRRLNQNESLIFCLSLHLVTFKFWQACCTVQGQLETVRSTRWSTSRHPLAEQVDQCWDWQDLGKHIYICLVLCAFL